jgi:flagellar hook-associated protein 2
MANGVLGLGSGQAASLNSDLIEKLKAAERKSTVAPIETNITKMTTEKETFSSISKKVSELLESIKPFDLFVSGGVTAFEQKSASTSGDSVTFDAADIKALNKGFTSVTVTKLAQKDVYQSNSVNGATKDTIINPLTATSTESELKINNETFDTRGKTYKQLADEITAKSGMNASIEQVGSDAYRLVIKSEDTGTSNKLTISGAASTFLGLDLGANNILKAQNLEATVDGVAYNVSSNTLNIDGLKITANKAGDSSINVTEDNTQIETQMNNFITKYNELVALVETEVQNSDSTLGDKATIRSLVSGIKDKLFGSYGSSGDKSVFNYGIQLDKYGSLSLDTTTFNKAVQNDKAGLKDLFAGVAEKKGLGTILKETLDSMTFTGGVLDTYEKAMLKRETTLNTDKTAAEQSLDKKYELLSTQFAAYGTIINQMESSFSGLKLMISQSSSGN